MSSIPVLMYELKKSPSSNTDSGIITLEYRTKPTSLSTSFQISSYSSSGSTRSNFVIAISRTPFTPHKSIDYRMGKTLAKNSCKGFFLAGWLAGINKLGQSPMREVTFRFGQIVTLEIEHGGTRYDYVTLKEVRGTLFKKIFLVMRRG